MPTKKPTAAAHDMADQFAMLERADRAIHNRVRALEDAVPANPEGALIAAFAAVVAKEADGIKHLFYRRDGDTLQLTLDMHGGDL